MPVQIPVPKVLINDKVCLVPENSNQRNLKVFKAKKENETDSISINSKTLEINFLLSVLGNSEFSSFSINKVLQFPKTISQELFSTSLTGLKKQ